MRQSATQSARVATNRLAAMHSGVLASDESHSRDSIALSNPIWSAPASRINEKTLTAAVSAVQLPFATAKCRVPQEESHDISVALGRQRKSLATVIFLRRLRVYGAAWDVLGRASLPLAASASRGLSASGGGGGGFHSWKRLASSPCWFHQASSKRSAFLKLSGDVGRKSFISTAITGCLPTSVIADLRIGP